jgi:hypothetical protein
VVMKSIMQILNVSSIEMQQSLLKGLRDAWTTPFIAYAKRGHVTQYG